MSATPYVCVRCSPHRYFESPRAFIRHISHEHRNNSLIPSSNDPVEEGKVVDPLFTLFKEIDKDISNIRKELEEFQRGRTTITIDNNFLNVLQLLRNRLPRLKEMRPDCVNSRSEYQRQYRCYKSIIDEHLNEVKKLIGRLEKQRNALEQELAELEQLRGDKLRDIEVLFGYLQQLVEPEEGDLKQNLTNYRGESNRVAED
ncbi:MAG: hypothetical protein QXW58_03060, partial [Thermosphaera sp.]